MQIKGRLSLIAPFVLRIGIAIVLLWFGVNELMRPHVWTAYVPEIVAQYLPFSVYLFVIFNGVVEVILGFLLVVGYRIRIVSGLVTLHLLLIVLSVGYNDIGVRDFGLFMAALSLFLMEHHPLSMDNRREG